MASILTATLIPGIGKATAKVPMCLDRPATIVGTPGDDIIQGTGDEDEVIVGLGGNDTIYGVEEEDSEEVVWICGNSGSDIVYSRYGGHLSGGRGDDQLHGSRLFGGPGDDILYGGWAFYSFAGGPITADLSTGVATGEGTDTLVGVTNIGGTSFADTLIGDESANFLLGDEGDDAIFARKGNDHLYGHEGNDRLFGQQGEEYLHPGLGDDLVNGGPGTDLVAFWSADGIRASLLTGWSEGEGQDRLVEIEDIWGSRDDDVLVGDESPNLFRANSGNDIIYGRGGDDTLIGDAGGTDYLDEVYGGRGNDRLGSTAYYDTKVDVVDGGPHRDECAVRPLDEVTNCEDVRDPYSRP